MAIIIPRINSGSLITDYSWLQRGYSYGVNDTGPFQRFKRSGRNADIEAWAALLAEAGWNVTVTRDIVVTEGSDTGFNPATADYGLSTIEASAGWPYPYIYGTETPEDIWELDPQDEKIDLLSSDIPNGLLQPLQNTYSVITTKQAIKDLVNTGLPVVWFDDTLICTAYPNTANNIVYEFDDLPNAINPDGTFVEPDRVHLPRLDYASAKTFYFLLHAGVEDFPIRAPIIRHSLVTSSLYAVQAATNNVGRVISTPSMYNIEGVPLNVLFNVPTQPNAQQFIQTQGDLQYGWRKPDPSVSRLNRLKWRIQQNYLFGLWPIQLFGNPL